MAEIAFDSLVSGKPIAIEVDGISVCLTRVGDEVFAVGITR